MTLASDVETKRTSSRENMSGGRLEQSEDAAMRQALLVQTPAKARRWAEAHSTFPPFRASSREEGAAAPKA